MSFVVGIAGGSGSGKTALAKAVSLALGPARVALLDQDRYYRDRSDLPADARAGLNYDVPDALDHDLFLAHLRDLRQGRPVVPPRYCFASHRRVGLDDPVPPRDVVLVEGLLLLHHAEVRAGLDFRIYLDAPEEVRLARRAARDVRERGRTRESVLEQCRTTVLPAHGRFVEPTRAWADLIILNVGRLDVLADIAARAIRARMARRPAGPAPAVHA